LPWFDLTVNGRKLDLAPRTSWLRGASMTAKERVCGKRVAILFESDLCIHSRHCVLDRPDVFVPNVAGA